MPNTEQVVTPSLEPYCFHLCMLWTSSVRRAPAIPERHAGDSPQVPLALMSKKGSFTGKHREALLRPEAQGCTYNPGWRGQMRERSQRGLVRAFVPPETTKAVAALLEPGTQTGRAWTHDATGFSLLCPQITDLCPRKLSGVMMDLYPTIKGVGEVKRLTSTSSSLVNNLLPPGPGPAAGCVTLGRLCLIMFKGGS